MIYRPYGQTAKEVSAIGFGGMRFPDPENIAGSAELVLYAHSRGITYIDTAPGYCKDKSEDITGAALRQMSPGSFAVSTKCGSPDGAELRQSLERSLDRLGVDCIDFYNIWCIKSQADWEARKAGGAVDALLKARDEGLVKHVVCSVHMTGDEAAAMFNEGIFEGVTLGYNAINFPFRQQVIDDAAGRRMGVVTMNPLNGGLIPQHARRFDFIRSREDPDVVSAALRFILSHPAVSTALVGFTSKQEIDQAVAAADRFTPLSTEHLAALKQQICEQFDGLCTGCGYCMPCPQGIRVPRMMDACNMRILNGPEPEHIINRLRYHWTTDYTEAERCTRCGACERACTQHLPIMERMQEIAAAGREVAAKACTR
jgi:predicted aldo/keto reductase-like oxidoreductase